MLTSDVIVYATPLYCWGFSSQMKAFLDRHYCLVTGYGTPEYKSLAQGKKVALLVTCAGPIEDNADLIQVAFSRLSDYSKSEVVGKYIVPLCTTPDAIGPEGMETAKRMVSDICA
jgi:multimeric flavodoxin WrbA